MRYKTEYVLEYLCLVDEIRFNKSIFPLHKYTNSNSEISATANHLLISYKNYPTKDDLFAVKIFFD